MTVEGNGNSQLVYSISDKESNLQGYLAIDSTVDGRAYGGLRMVPAISPTTSESPHLVRERMLDSILHDGATCELSLD